MLCCCAVDCLVLSICITVYFPTIKFIFILIILQFSTFSRITLIHVSDIVSMCIHGLLKTYDIEATVAVVADVPAETVPIGNMILQLSICPLISPFILAIIQSHYTEQEGWGFIQHTYRDPNKKTTFVCTGPVLHIHLLYNNHQVALCNWMM